MVTTRITPAMYTILFASIAILLVFSIFLYKETGHVTELQGQSGESIKNSIPGVQTEINQLRVAIAKKSELAALLEKERKRLDSELGKYRTYGMADGVHSGMGTTTFAANVQGQPLTTNSSAVSKGHVLQVNARLEAKARSVAGDDWQKMPALEDLISKRQDQLAALQKRITDLDAAFKDDEDKLKAQQEKDIATRDKAVRKNNDDMSTRLTKINKLEVEIRKLLELELRWQTELEPVGRILECNANNPRVIINLGTSDNVSPGMYFEAFQYDRGTYRTKGLIEVVEVRPKIAVCRVVNVADHKTWPLAENDYLGNPIYSTDRPKTFVVAGDFMQFNRTDIESFIRQAGGIVRDSLSPGVDYLVVPSKEYKGREIERAREFQVLAIDEEHILRFVRTEFKPVAKKK